MADEDPQQADGGEGSLPGLLPGLHGAEASALQLRIKNSICKSVQSKVENILQDVEKFSDIEKLYLYLKLPSGPCSSTDKSDHSSLSSSRTQQMHAFSWIRDHLEEYPETSLPKQEVYDEYKSFCDNLNYHPLSAADFGKMMKNVFPNMKARRLGMRGKSKYCYSGLRKKPCVHMPSLPMLDFSKTAEGPQSDVPELAGHMSSIKDEVRFAACDLVCEWAQKVLKRQFDAVEDLARFLVDSHNISNKSLAALTVMTSAATEVKPLQSVSAFAPMAQAHPFQPHVTMLSSPSVDAKQQLQKKIQRKQQEQKLHSPLPANRQTKRADDGVSSSSPTAPSPQPAIGIVVASVPSPITVQRSSQLMSPSPVATMENKVLPINFQMVSQPVQAIKQSPKPMLSSPAGERTARQRYAQILPKPSVTTSISLRSPSTMIITNSPVRTVMTSCHVSPVSLVSVAASSLAANKTTSTMTNTSITTPDNGPATGEESGFNQSHILALVDKEDQFAFTQNMDIEMEVEAIHKNSQMQHPSSQVFTEGVPGSRPGGALQRAASVPIPQTKSFLSLEEAPKYSERASASTASSNNGANNSNTLPLNASNRSTNSLLSTSRLSSFGENTQTKEDFTSTKSFRKRSGLSSELSPVKRAFMTEQPAEGAAGLGFDIRNQVGNVFDVDAPARPESAPACREVEMIINSVLSTQDHTQCTSSFTACHFDSVAKTDGSLQRKNTPAVLETGTSVHHAVLQEQQGHTMAHVHAVPSKPAFQKHTGVRSNSTTGNLEGAQQHTFVRSSPAVHTLPFLNQTPSGLLTPQDHMDYFSFDDDVTQDSIVEELVQMEEHMKLKRLEDFGHGDTLHSQHVPMQGSMTSTNQTMTAVCYAANNSNPIQASTPTSEMMGGPHSLTAESPFSRIASTTPVDSALGSSRHTPAGTPHSNCSSTVPPSPVECRNPFAFTPINSTGFHDNSSSVSSSPVKPMQRPMATHPDKARLEWMSSSYNSGVGGTNKANSGMGILSSYQGLIDDQFRKPHAFAVPHSHHYDSHFGRLTPISPVQQQVASMAKQEGFAVPAPLDNKTTNSSAAAFRCRSVSPALHQRNLVGNPGNSSLPNVTRLVGSPFNSPVTPEVLSIFSNSETGLGSSSMAQRSRSVPVNIMMESEALPTHGQQCSSRNITSVLLSKLDRDQNDSTRGLGINNLPSTYSARMNLTQILESSPSLSCTDNHHSLRAPDSASACSSQRLNCHNGKAMNEPIMFSAGNSQVPSASRGLPQQQTQPVMLAFSSQQQQDELRRQQHLDFSSTQHLLDRSLEQASELTTGTADFPCEIRMTSELSSSIGDLNGLDTNLLFNPNQPQGQYQNTASEVENDELFLQHSGGLDWLESKDHPTVGLMG
ncbi:DNA-binding protein RFX7 [Oryzias melastigma]|nr:DNA-binding protein RFX7 [Oryzias melastigma]